MMPRKNERGWRNLERHRQRLKRKMMRKRYRRKCLKWCSIATIAKNLYAEAMIAYDLLAKYWNMYNSGVDGQAIMYFLEEQRNCLSENP